MGTAGLLGTAGCVQRTRALLGRSAPHQLSLTIKTLPTDADPWSIRTARFLADNLQAVGVEARVVPTSRISLLRDVLVNQSFDLYVARAPAFADADALRTLLHSRFRSEPGWQNPFGYADLSTDDLLEQQRRQTGERRRETLWDLQDAVVRDQPFSVVAYPDEIHAVRSDRLRRWPDHKVDTPLGYLALDRYESEDAPIQWNGTSQPTATETDATARERARTLRMTTTDARAPENLNPLAVEYRSTDALVGLLYDPLGRRVDDRVRPWLASDWTWQSGAGSGPALDVTLRDEATWHDGTSLTASDVAFTYKFLKDTSLGTFESPLPAPLFRSQSSLVADARAYDEKSVRVQFVPSTREVARRALTVPVLPEHVWQSKTERATIAGVDSGREVTEAVIWNNQEPVGSGPLVFERADRQQLLSLVRADDHFLYQSDLDDHLAPYQGGFSFDRLQFVVAPSGGAAVRMVEDGTADGTATGVTPSSVPRIGRSDSVELHTHPSPSFYHLGFNARRSPYDNPRFRRAVAQLFDKAYLTESVFDGYARPATSPLAHLPSLEPSLEWSGRDAELPFPGDAGDLDVEKAREAFRTAGYRYTDDGRLVLS
ncbi:MAG: ABC transporter substrate-binding protein [Haloarculaceae archaeon]